MIYLKLFLTFLMIGAFTFGGGYAMLPLIQQEVVANEWMTQEEIIDFIAVSESTPGPFAVNVSTYIGYETGGLFGAICASLGVVLPSFVIILLVAKMYEKFRKSAVVNGCMEGLRPAVIGLIGSAALTTAQAAFALTNDFVMNLEFLPGIALLALTGGLLIKKVNPIIVIIFSAVAGILIKSFL